MVFVVAINIFLNHHKQIEIPYHSYMLVPLRSNCFDKTNSFFVSVRNL
jgi:hypothetical protein